MNKTVKSHLTIGITLLFTAIILGAFGAHGLEGKVSDKMLNAYEVGVKYQTYTALGILLLAVIEKIFELNLKKAVSLILVGVLFFLCSIYGLVINEMFDLGVNRILGPITPLGGLLMIVGWISVLLGVRKVKTVN